MRADRGIEYLSEICEGESEREQTGGGGVVVLAQSLPLYGYCLYRYRDI
jgi:hypothetical protein